MARLESALAGRYGLERELGAGGMAIVYLAHDERHDRRVAVKVLRPELSAILGAERFLQEIKVTANLQHSHILPLYDSGSADGLLFYVMPYVEGESLRDRLTREKQLPVDQAVRLTVQVASALDYAHKRGVIHRDIKPENILLRDGDALVADFGIALAVRNAGGHRMTESGLSLGTPQYMSPEQATADRELDARSDVYSLGSVLYEMLAGEAPHTGPTAQAIIARLMTEDPRPITMSRPTVPAHVEEALHTALQRLPADRYPSAAQFADALMNPSAATRVRPGVAKSAGRTGGRRRAVSGLALAGAAVAGAVVASLWRGTTPAPEMTRRFAVVLPDTAQLWFYAPSYFGEGRQSLALSPDGKTLVYTARVHGASMLGVRPLDRDSVRLLPGTAGASDPTFSPDGEWIAFLADGAVKKVALADGRVVTLASVRVPSRLGWMDRDRIIVREFYVGSLVVPASGGTPVPSRDSAHVDGPRPGPAGWLIGASTDDHIGLWDPRAQRGQRVTAPGGDTAGLTGTSPLYSGSGHVLYVRDTTLMALPYDGRRRRALGPAVPVLAGIRHENVGAGQVTMAGDGTFAFVRGSSDDRGRLVWATNDGVVRGTLPVPSGEHLDFRISPDGRLLWLKTQGPDARSETRIIDLRTGLERAVPGSGSAVWWPDSRKIVLVSPGYSLSIALAGVPRVDTLLGRGWRASAVSPDTTWMAASGPAPDSSGIWVIGHGVRVRTPPLRGWSNFSPDGRWLVGTGGDGLYVSPVPATGEVVKIAGQGADEPEWSPRGDQVYYRSGTRWYAVAITTAGGFRASQPRLMFQGRFLQAVGKSWDVGPDRSFLLLVGEPTETASRIEVITNFFAELRRLAPPR